MISSTAMMVATVAAMAISAAGAVMQGAAARSAAKADAKSNRAYAKYAKRQAAYNADLQRKKNARILAEQRTGFAANGVELTGSYYDVMRDSAYSGELDALAIESEGKLQASKYRQAAASSSAEGSAAWTGGLMSAGGSILGGVSKMSMMDWPSIDTGATSQTNILGPTAAPDYSSDAGLY